MPENSTAISESVADRCFELPEDLAEGFFEVFVDADVLVVAEAAVGELGEGFDVVVVGVVFPAGGEVGVVFDVLVSVLGG